MVKQNIYIKTKETDVHLLGLRNMGMKYLMASQQSLTESRVPKAILLFILILYSIGLDDLEKKCKEDVSVNYPLLYAHLQYMP